MNKVNKLSMNFPRRLLLVFIILVGLTSVNAQQDPQYTQYMYNTMSINPAYAGSQGYFTATALARTQWVGFPGAPETQTFSFNKPLGYSGVGIGLNIINDKLGPSSEVYFDGNVSYTIRTSEEGNLAFGLRLGGRSLSLDWSKGRYQNEDAIFNQNVNNRFLPSIGAGLYYHKTNWYVGLSIPNFIRTDHYDDFVESIAAERLHYFLIGGYVFNLSDDIKFKPAFISKIVSGAPLSVDLSANFLFYEKFTLGIAYRWDDSISTLLRLKVNKNWHIGYAYDLTTSNYRNYNSGTHELMLIFDVTRAPKLKSPRFF
ncbi:type IX secretion system PorP/SprF family membrane protein [Lutibacter sp. Hel_I_33_5]|uniref:PorP/SprF family type IX secretion system membrane protein n=1 Tax=Lutibacter sp. Hel_I_33_5 TaxID=1566289 RepID=UPI0011AC68D5|nr:type IX secretion system membrane protein PorP/SprF [Lutibacter sp. Hel_I_33_5]TVZ55678.1 type IX secretion system PorP/SprF family membrane protein [Lutibacter sp. Hel_I_33_5]